MHTLYRYRLAGLFILAWMPFVAASDTETGTSTPLVASSSPISASVAATLSESAGGAWTLALTGSVPADASITGMSLVGMDASGTPLASMDIDPAHFPSTSPFSDTFPIQEPDPDWSNVEVKLTVSEPHGSVAIHSAPFPIIWDHPVRIDHATSGSIVVAPNYDAGDIPEGIGIPHTLINSVPEGDYYAVVFFEGLKGCPSDNYEINAFRAHAYWGYDIRGPSAPYAKAFGTSAGGCMQRFHIDPQKGGDWLWGALSNTGTTSAIADTDGIPAFAICATAAACQSITPHEALASSSQSSTDAHLVSNVLFLPGIKGSKLYEDNPLCLIPGDACGIPLWLPLADISTPELFLDENGKSKSNVFVREGNLLGSAFGQDFYDSFTQMLSRAKEEGTFGSTWDWKAVAYDWRLSLPDIIHGGVQEGSRIYYAKASSTPYIQEVLQELASTSPAGKVTIIAHSNGGLVAKALLQSLGSSAASRLIDSVLLIGVPQSGAPRALGALLYGDEEGIPGIRGVPNVIMSASHAREFARNSPMAYHLLPSATYLKALQPDHPLVEFEAGSLLSAEHAAFGSAVETPEELRSFALATDGDRVMPDAHDLDSANVLNADLLAYAEAQHASLDTWQPPPGIEIYQLGGYGVPTVSGLDLYEAPHANGTRTLSYRPLFITDGDGTVPIISSLMMNVSNRVHQVWLDLPAMRSGNRSYSHGNMLEAGDVQSTIMDVLSGSSAYPPTVHAMELTSAAPEKQLAFYVHSPVSLTVSDTDGNKSSVSSKEETEGIPGSSSGMLGEVKYVLVPESGAPYTLSLSGEGTGTFTLDMQERANDSVIASSTIADVPVTDRTNAQMSISGSLADASPLKVDVNGDGTDEALIPVMLGATVFPPISSAAPEDMVVRRTARKVIAMASSVRLATERLLASAPLATTSAVLPVPAHSSSPAPAAKPVAQRTQPKVLGLSYAASSSGPRVTHEEEDGRASMFSRLYSFLVHLVHRVLWTLKSWVSH